MFILLVVVQYLYANNNRSGGFLAIWKQILTIMESVSRCKAGRFIEWLLILVMKGNVFDRIGCRIKKENI